MADRAPARGRWLGRAAVHRHRLPERLLHQLPPLQDQLPPDGARALPGGGGAAPSLREDRRADRGRVNVVAEQPAGAPAAEAVMARAATENFSVAGVLLPRRERAHLLAIYGFARLVDELGDAHEGD